MGFSQLEKASKQQQRDSAAKNKILKVAKKKKRRIDIKNIKTTKTQQREDIS